MTSGSAFRLLIQFAVPLMIGNVFQQLYTMTDAVIVGRGVGISALASLGAGEWILWLVLGSLQGFTQGFSIETASAFGEANEERILEALFHTVILSAGLGVLFTIVSEILAEPVLVLLGTPPDILPGTLSYLRILYGGSLVIVFYDMNAALLRSFGNSSVPLAAMITASLINVILDYVLVFRFGKGIAGAGAATVIAQLTAGIICALPLRRYLRKEHISRIDRKMIKKLWKLGAPLAFQVVVIAAGGIVLQSVVNRCGSSFVAGYTAANKLFGLLESAAISFGYGILTYTAQNLGAGKPERIRDGVRAGLVFSFGTSAVIAACMLVFGKNILSLFIDPSGNAYQEVLAIAYRYLSVMAWALPVLYLLHLYKNILQGYGKTVASMNSGMVELGVRVSAVFLLYRLIGRDGIFFAEVAAWAGAALYLFVFWRRLSKDEKQI